MLFKYCLFNKRLGQLPPNVSSFKCLSSVERLGSLLPALWPTSYRDEPTQPLAGRSSANPRYIKLAPNAWGLEGRLQRGSSNPRQSHSSSSTTSVKKEGLVHCFLLHRLFPLNFSTWLREARSPLLSLMYIFKGESIKRTTILKGGRTALYRALASKPTTCLASKDVVHSISGQKYRTVIPASLSSSLFILVYLADVHVKQFLSFPECVLSLSNLLNSFSSPVKLDVKRRQFKRK